MNSNGDSNISAVATDLLECPDVYRCASYLDLACFAKMRLQSLCYLENKHLLESSGAADGSSCV